MSVTQLQPSSHKPCPASLGFGVVPDWFHGAVSRQAAESMLMSKPPGYFLVRVSQSRTGYTLSIRVQSEIFSELTPQQPCAAERQIREKRLRESDTDIVAFERNAEEGFRHFMIDALKNGQFSIVGEAMQHPSLQDLLVFHQHVPILPFKDLLTEACDKDDSMLEVPSVLACHSSHCSGSSAQSHPSRLYPYIETEALTMKISSIALQDPPEPPPPRSLHSRIAETSTGRSSLPQPRIDTPAPPSARSCNAPANKRRKGGAFVKSAVLKIMPFKKTLHTKDVDSEVGGEAGTPASALQSTDRADTPGENVYEELHGDGRAPETSTVSPVTGEALPAEYLTPPPYAPGY